MDSEEEFSFIPHLHSIHKGSMKDKKCDICLRPFIGCSSISSIRCDECDIDICEDCCSKFHYYKKYIEHEHPLFFMKKEEYKCEKCGRVYKGITSMDCNICNIDYCLYCYFNEDITDMPKTKDGNNIDEGVHRHPFIENTKIRNSICDSCGVLIIGNVFICEKCNINLCNVCKLKFDFAYKNVVKDKHIHPFISKKFDEFKCNICQKDFQNRISFFCLKCNYYLCQDCYCRDNN
jgi:hypothetical protein